MHVEVEIQKAIKSMQSGKSSGPDGFTAEFYKLFSSSLTPALARLYNDSFKECHLPHVFMRGFNLPASFRKIRTPPLVVATDRCHSLMLILKFWPKS